MRATHRLAAIALAALAAGCSTTKPFIPDKDLWITQSVKVSYEALAAAAVAGVVIWYVADPLAPTWGVNLRKVAEDRYRIELRQKKFALGGDGEAQQVFHRAAEKLAEEKGYAGYRILTYTESLESGPLLDQRTSRGMVELTNAPEQVASF
jgi:hypothetical protein